MLNFAAKMKKEFGKWLMDIAKYMVTALLLSTIFADMEEPIIVYMVVILSIVVLIIGLILVSDDTPNKIVRKERRNEHINCIRLNGLACHSRAYLFQV